MPRIGLGITALVLACSSEPPPQAVHPPVPSASPPRPAVLPSAAPSTYQGLGVESIPPEVLARHAATPLPPDESRRIQGMLDVRAPAAGLVSMDGKRMYFTWSVTGTTQIWRLDGPMSFPVQLTGGEDTTLIADLTPDGKRLLVSRDRSGEENPGLYVLPTEGGALQPIQHKPGVQTFLDRVSDDGRFVYFRANDIAKDSYALYRYELGSEKRETIFSEPGLWRLADTRKERMLVEKSVGSNMTEFFELDPATKKLEPLFGQGEREDYRAAYGAEDGEVLVLTPKLGEFRRLYAWKKGEMKPVTPEMKSDVAAFSIDRARTRIYYQVNEGGYTRAFVLDAKTKKPIEMPKLPAGLDHVFFGRTSNNARYTALSIDPGTSPAQAFVYDWDARKLDKWHAPAIPEIDASKFVRATLESYQARDGTSVPMFVRRPHGCGEKLCPVIVSFHGGPEAQALPGFSTSGQLFVDAGFILVEPNVRGSDGYGKSYLHADDGAKRQQILSDIEDAGKHVRRQFAVGKKAPKVGIYGGSYGGYSTLVGMTIFAGTYDAGVSVVGISSLVTFLMNTAPYRRILRISEYGDPEKDRKALEALSPITHLDKLKGPMLLIQGATDPRVPVGEALQFYEALQKKKIPSGLIIFPDEGHGMRKRQNQVSAIGHTIRFFKTHLK